MAGKRKMAKKPKIVSKEPQYKIVKEIQTVMGKRNGKKISLREVRAMLVYLLDNYDLVSYEKNILTIHTEDIFYGGHNYGTYILRLNLKGIFASESGFETGITFTPRGRRHVYSSSGNLCFGSGPRGGYRAAQKCIQDGRIDDYVDIVQQVLRS